MILRGPLAQPKFWWSVAGVDAVVGALILALILPAGGRPGSEQPSVVSTTAVEVTVTAPGDGSPGAVSTSLPSGGGPGGTLPNGVTVLPTVPGDWPVILLPGVTLAPPDAVIPSPQPTATIPTPLPTSSVPSATSPSVSIPADTITQPPSSAPPTNPPPTTEAPPTTTTFDPAQCVHFWYWIFHLDQCRLILPPPIVPGPGPRWTTTTVPSPPPTHDD